MFEHSLNPDKKGLGKRFEVEVAAGFCKIRYAY